MVKNLLASMKTKLRLEIFNLTRDQWDKIKSLEINGYQIECTPQELIDTIGLSGGSFIGTRVNEEERKFIDEYYRLGRDV